MNGLRIIAKVEVTVTAVQSREHRWRRHGSTVGDTVGADVGWDVGKAVGFEVGFEVGSAVGLAVGDFVGLAVGVDVGTAVGNIVGAIVGDVVWCEQSPGLDSSSASYSSVVVSSPVRQSCRSESQPQLKYTDCPSSDVEVPSPGARDRPFSLWQHDVLHKRLKTGWLQSSGFVPSHHWQIGLSQPAEKPLLLSPPSPLPSALPSPLLPSSTPPSSSPSSYDA